MEFAVASSAVLARIAHKEGLELMTVYLDGETVFLRSVDGLRTVCQVGSNYWLEVWSELVAEAFINHCSN